jgi:hypothetical protein
MSKDKILLLTSATAKYTDLEIDIINALRGPHAELASNLFSEALAIRESEADATGTIKGAIVHVVKVNLSYTAQEAITATRRVPYTIASIVDEMPRVGNMSEVTLNYVNLRRLIPFNMLNARLNEFYPKYRLADPFEFAADGEADPAFFDDHYCATEFLDKNGDYCDMVLRSYGDERRVHVGRRTGIRWDIGWWYPLVLK